MSLYSNCCRTGIEKVSLFYWKSADSERMEIFSISGIIEGELCSMGTRDMLSCKGLRCSSQSLSNYCEPTTRLLTTFSARYSSSVIELALWGLIEFQSKLSAAGGVKG